jgi:hypothetical protein
LSLQWDAHVSELAALADANLLSRLATAYANIDSLNSDAAAAAPKKTKDQEDGTPAPTPSVVYLHPASARPAELTNEASALGTLRLAPLEKTRHALGDRPHAPGREEVQGVLRVHQHDHSGPALGHEHGVGLVVEGLAWSWIAGIPLIGPTNQPMA